MSGTHQGGRNPMQLCALLEDEATGDASTAAELAQAEKAKSSKVRPRSQDDEPSLRSTKAPRLASMQEGSNYDDTTLKDLWQPPDLAQQEVTKREARWAIERDENARLRDDNARLQDPVRKAEARLACAERGMKAIKELVDVDRQFITQIMNALHDRSRKLWKLRTSPETSSNPYIKWSTR